MANAESAPERPGLDAPSSSAPRGRDRYGLLLALIAASITFGMAAPENGWGEGLAFALQAGVLLLALRTAAASRRAIRLAVVAILVIELGVLGWAVAGLPAANGLPALASLVLVMVAATAIVRRLLVLGTLGGRTILGALCIYLLVGMAFAFAFSAVAAFDPAPLFRGTTDVSLAQVQYFSFTTLTTVGYGDLAPGSNVGRSMAMLEALVGQIYLVTVIALLVGNLRLPGLRGHRTDTAGPGWSPHVRPRGHDDG